RGVAVRAAVVGADAATAEHVERLMTRATRDSVLLLEIMRLVATRAGGVPRVEQGRRRDQRLLLGVALRAGAERILGGRVPVLVAVGARLHERLAARVVGRRDVLVAVVARRRLGSPFVRLVTAQTRLG